MNVRRIRYVYPIEVARLRLLLSRPLLPHEAVLARGFISNVFPEEFLIHHHKSGGLDYSYPKAQFKIVDGSLLIVGIQEGANIVSSMANSVNDLLLGNEKVKVLDVSLTQREEEFGVSDYEAGYEFLTPWLALNQDNHFRYINCRKPGEVWNLLKRTLAGNCLSMSKGLGIVVADALHSHLDVKEKRCTLKGMDMIGFTGNFRINFLIPDYMGIGKSVSRGFGTVRRIADGESTEQSHEFDISCNS